MLGVCAVLPYQLKMIEGKLEKARATSTKKIPSQPILILFSIIQSAFLLAVATGIGLWLAPKVNLHWWIITHWLTGQPIPFPIQKVLIIAIVSGVVTALVIAGLDRLFKAKMPPVQEDSQIPGPIHGFCVFLRWDCRRNLIETLSFDIIFVPVSMDRMARSVFFLGSKYTDCNSIWGRSSPGG